MRDNSSEDSSQNTSKEKEVLLKEIEELRLRVQYLESEKEKNKQIENDLFQSQKMLQLILDAIPQRVFWKDKNFKFLGCNKALAKDAGFENPESIIGKDDFELPWKDVAHLYREKDEQIIQSNQSILTFEEPQTSGSGETRWLRTSKIPLHDKQGNVIGLLGTYEDITESKNAQIQLQKERILLRTLIDNLPDAIYVKDRKCRKTIANFADIKNMGLSQESDVVGKTDFEIFPREIAEKFYADDLNVINNKIPILNREESFIDPNGEERWLLTSKLPLLDDNGEVIGLMGIGHDITDRKKTEEKLKETAEKLKLIFENAFDGISIYEDNSDPKKRKLIDCNDHYAKMAGRSRDELLKIGYTFTLQRNYTSDNYESNLHKNGAYHGTFSWLRPDGKDNIVEYAAVPIQIKGKTFIIGIDRDATKQKRAEEALQLERNQLRVLIDSLPDLIYFQDSRGKYILNNRAHLNYLGKKNQAEVIGKTAFDFNLKPIAEKAFEEDKIILQTGKPLKEKEEIVFHKGTGELRWYLTSKIPLKDHHGRITGILGVSHDITNRKRSEETMKKMYEELEKTNDDLQKANKIKSQFLANMSHEIRTPLNAIIGLTGLLLNTNLTDEQRDFVSTINSSGDILLTLINDILDFSKIEAQKIELEKQPFDIRTCVEEALDLVASKAADKGLELIFSMDEGLSTNVIGDVTRVRQILVNLLSNSIKFTEKGEVVVSVSGQLHDNNNYQVQFAVKDTGLGIPLDRQDRLFKSFSQVDSSTTRKFGGTGLGLAISKQLSELMGGRMWVESSGIPGDGTTFYFTIVAELSVQKEDEIDLTGLAGKKILIVDDNKTNREILIRQIKSLRMIPEGVYSGLEALELLKSGSVYDLVILDFHMPEMDGIMLAQEIRKLKECKTLPLILLSSYGYREKNSFLSNFSAILTKPIKASSLLSALSTVLNKKTIVKKKHDIGVMQFDTSVAKNHPLRILLAEDNIVNQKVAIKFLERIGYRADIAFNGIEVLDALKRQVYDVVLMDVQMPEMDGEQATIEIRKQFPQNRQPRIIAMTANAMKSDRDRYLAGGMDDYIVKPFKMEDLVRALIECQPVIDNEANLIKN